MRTVSKKQTTPGVTLGKKEAESIVKKVAAVADSTKTLSKELKSISKIFAENQKVLVSLKDMIDTLATTLEQIQKQSKQIDIIEEDTQKLFAGLNQVRSQAAVITKVTEHVNKLQDQINKLSQIQKESPDPQSIIKAVEESKNSIQNNTHMIIKIAQRIDNIKEDLENISSKSDTGKIANEITLLKQELAGLVAEGAAKSETIIQLRGEIQKIESELKSLLQRADQTAFVGEGLKSVQVDLSALKENVFNKTNTIDQKISSLAELVRRSESSMSEFHKKTDKIFEEIGNISKITSKSSEDTSKEVIALLKLSEFQSNMRIVSESKYGELKDIEKMAEQTAFIVNLFDRLAIETEQKIALPQEVRQWALSKILDSADKWEIRFSDLLAVLLSKLGREMLKENIRLNQVRDIFGIRGVDEIKKELNLQGSTS